MKDMSGDLLLVIIPVMITAIVSLITTLINSVFQIVLQNKRYNAEQYKMMQLFYPKLKVYLIELKLAVSEVEKSGGGLGLEDAVNKYLEYESGETEYREQHTEEIQYIDSVVSAVKKYTDRMVTTGDFFKENMTPGVPAWHIFLKKRISIMLATLQYYSALWDRYNVNEIEKTILQSGLSYYLKKWKMEIDSKTVEEYLELLDKWFMAY